MFARPPSPLANSITGVLSPKLGRHAVTLFNRNPRRYSHIKRRRKMQDKLTSRPTVLREFYDLEAVNIVFWAAASGFFDIAGPLFAQKLLLSSHSEYKFN